MSGPSLKWTGSLFSYLTMEISLQAKARMKGMRETYESIYKAQAKRCLALASHGTLHTQPGLVVVYILLGALRLSDLIFRERP